MNHQRTAGEWFCTEQKSSHDSYQREYRIGARWPNVAEHFIGRVYSRHDAEFIVAAANAALPPAHGWQPIETAPERKKVLVSWINALGKRRTAMASYWPAGQLEMAEDVPDYQVTESGTNLDAGWWEESEGNDDAMFRLVETMTHWMPLPDPPTAHGWQPQEQEKGTKEEL